MLHKRLSTSQIDREYRNVDEEGRGTMRYYHHRNKGIGMRLLIALAAVIGVILVGVYVVSLLHGHTYGQQWMLIVKDIFGHTPGTVDNNSFK